MSEKSAAAKRRRDEATECHYCRCSLTHNIPVRLDTDATVEHLNSRNQFPNGRPNVDNTIVIACRRYNEDRAAEEQARRNEAHRDRWYAVRSTRSVTR